MENKTSKTTYLRLVLASFLSFAPLPCLWASLVSQDEAIRMTAGWLNEGRQRLEHTMPTTIAGARTFTNASGQAIYYIVSLLPRGFIVVAANDGVEPVIAFSATGGFDPNAENPLFVLLESDMSQRTDEAMVVEASIKSKRTVAPTLQNAATMAEQSRGRWRDLLARAADRRRADTTEPAGLSSVSDVRVSPLVQSKWNQKAAQSVACYNYYCPPGPDGNVNNYYCGCVATAMGQLMRHWQRPASAYAHSYVYTNMPLNPQTQSPLTTSQCQSIGRLLRDAGTAVSMSYGSGGSSADMLIVDAALTGVFGYSNARDIYRSAGIDATTRNLVLRSNLAAHLPVLLGVHRSGGGHAIICDGFGYSSGTLYYHVNMGWGGADDAWYNLPTVDAYYTYTSVDAFVYNIYTNGTGEIIAGRVLASGTAVSGAVVTATGGYSASTDAQGYYGVRVPSAATYSLTAVKPGLQSQTLGSISVGTSSASYSGNCGNYFGADFSLSPFLLRAVALTNNVILRWPNPTACGYSNQTAHVRHHTSRYPTNTTDGTLTYEGTNQVFEHSGLTPGQPYYYTIWLSDDGVNFVEPP